MRRFLALGNCTLDDVITPEGTVAPRQVGGNGVYAAVGMRVWGEAVSLVSVVGNDFPERYLARLAEGGINVSSVKTLAQPHRLQSRVFYFPTGERTDLVEEATSILPPNAADLLDLVSEYPSTGSPMHRRLWPLFTPLPDQLPTDLSDVAGAHLAPGALPNNRSLASAIKGRSGGRVAVSLDWPWWDWDQEGQANRALLQNVDYLLPSVAEASVYADAVGLDPFDAVRSLLDGPPHFAVVKLGTRGSRVLPGPESKWMSVPVFATRVIDPTGAGDAFCGGFLVGMVRTGDAVQAALYGAVSASFVIEDFGPLHALNVLPSVANERLSVLQEKMEEYRTVTG